MLVTTFRLEEYEIEPTYDPRFDQRKVIYKIATLPAYAIISSHVEMDFYQITYSEMQMAANHQLLEDGVLIDSHALLIESGQAKGVLAIYHNGIKDYQLLFPHIEDQSLKTRLGQFAEEANKAFESQSWVSYCLMVGGVLEGLLFNKFGKKTFHKLIQLAKNNKVITEEEAELINNVRLVRNRIHAEKHHEPIADRKTALELSVTYDRLIKRNWDN